MEVEPTLRSESETRRDAREHRGLCGGDHSVDLHERLRRRQRALACVAALDPRELPVEVDLGREQSPDAYAGRQLRTLERALDGETFERVNHASACASATSTLMPEKTSGCTVVRASSERKGDSRYGVNMAMHPPSHRACHEPNTCKTAYFRPSGNSTAACAHVRTSCTHSDLRNHARWRAGGLRLSAPSSTSCTSRILRVPTRR